MCNLPPEIFRRFSRFPVLVTQLTIRMKKDQLPMQLKILVVVLKVKVMQLKILVVVVKVLVTQLRMLTPNTSKQGEKDQLPTQLTMPMMLV